MRIASLSSSSTASWGFAIIPGAFTDKTFVEAAEPNYTHPISRSRRAGLNEPTLKGCPLLWTFESYGTIRNCISQCHPDRN